MVTLREAAQQALEALETFRDISDFTPAAAVHAITALRAALAEPVQPVAWRSKNADPPGGYVVFQQYPQALADLEKEIEPLYTAPNDCAAAIRSRI